MFVKTLDVLNLASSGHNRENIRVRLAGSHIEPSAVLVLAPGHLELERGLLGVEGGRLPILQQEVIDAVTV